MDTDTDEKNNPHLILARLGVKMWNRWVKTILSEFEIETFNIPAESKKRFQRLNSFTEDEKCELATTLGLNDFSELDRDVFFNGVMKICDFSAFYFPGIVNFSRTTFAKNADFTNAIFLKEIYFTNVLFENECKFRSVFFLNEVDIGQATFKKNAIFNDAVFNEYVDFSGSVINGKAYFSNVKFNSDAIFSDCKFDKGSDFKNVTFGMDALFDRGCYFFQEAYFNNAVFCGKANFFRARFSKRTFFLNTEFNGYNNFESVKFKNNHVLFINTKFNSSTAFISTTFDLPPIFHNTDLHQDTSFHKAKYLKKVGSEDCVRAWRTLKLAMNKIHDHQSELLYFRFEMDARRYVLKSEKKQMPYRFLLGLYKLSSNYGTAIWRPSALMIALLFIFTIIYSFSIPEVCPHSSFFEDMHKGAQLSIANILPFAPISKTVLKDVFSVFGGISITLQVITTLQNILSIMLLFLIGLALKHRLSIK